MYLYQILVGNKPADSGQAMKELILSTGCDISRFKNFWGTGTADSNSFTIRQRKKRRYKFYTLIKFIVYLIHIS